MQNLLNTLMRHSAAAGLVLNSSKTVPLTTEAQPPFFIQHSSWKWPYDQGNWSYRSGKMVWLHTVRLRRSSLRSGTSFTTRGQGFPEAPLDVTIQGLFCQTSAAVFRRNCFFNSLLRCRTPTMVRSGQACTPMAGPF